MVQELLAVADAIERLKPQSMDFVRNGEFANDGWNSMLISHLSTFSEFAALDQF
jgi:hypothetical protein